MCQPVQSAWDITVTPTGCGDFTYAFGAVAIVDILTDLNADFVNITRGFATASVSGTIQLGIAVMVASSPMLRPVFDHALVNWFNITLLSSKNIAKRGQRGSMTIGGINSRPSQPRSNAGFQHMSESEEHLAWEMQGLGKKNEMQTSIINAGRTSDDSGQTPSGGDIVVTTTTTTSMDVLK